MEDHAQDTTFDPEDQHRGRTSPPLSPAQLGVYFEHFRDVAGGSLNIGQVTSIVGDLDIDVFRRAAAQVIAETPALNLAIVSSGDEPHQEYVDRSAVEIGFYDLRQAADPEVARLACLKQVTFTPFDLARDALFRWALIKTREGATDWVQVYHHIVVDGWSAQLLVSRVATCYGLLLAGDTASGSANAEPEPYADHIAEQLAYQSSDAAVREGGYWRDLLSGADVATPFEARHTTCQPANEAHFVRHGLVLEGER
ncbi:MAG: enterobactin synthetase component F, partial [Dinoroseobacter sp.]